MSGVKGAWLEYDEEDEHILRRLGSAVIIQWPDLPEQVRNLLEEQAVFVNDKHGTVQLPQQIRIFIEKHQGTA